MEWEVDFESEKSFNTVGFGLDFNSEMEARRSPSLGTSCNWVIILLYVGFQWRRWMNRLAMKVFFSRPSNTREMFALVVPQGYQI